MRLTIVFILSLLAVVSNAQDKYFFERVYNESELLLQQGKYNEALPLLLQLDSAKNDIPNISYKIGVCYLHTYNKKLKATSYLEKAVQKVSKKYKQDNYKEKSAPPKAYFYLGKVYHLNHRFNEASIAFQNYREYLDDKEVEELNETNRMIEVTRNAKNAIENPVDVKFQNLGKEINTKYSEYAPVITADESTLMFTSRRKKESIGENIDNLGNDEDIYISYKKDEKWTEAKPISNNINSDMHDGSLSISADGRKLFIYKYDGEKGDIYESNLIGDNWSEPQKLGENVNSDANETHACISPDGNFLYFSSDREGGFGKRDIYVSRKLPNGKWGKAQNLGSVINTPYDETIPFIHNDNRTLYFTSTGHNTIGGADIFKSELKQGYWQTPKNIGYPINTTDNDYFFVPTTDGAHAYYATARFVTDMGLFDIYRIDFPTEKVKPIRVVIGYLKTQKENLLPSGLIHLYNAKNDSLVGIYRPNKKSGKFVFILENGKSYKMVATGEKFYKHQETMDIPDDDNFSEIKMDIKVKPVKIGEDFVLKSLIYEEETQILTPKSIEKIKTFLNFLDENKYPVFKVKLVNSNTKQTIGDSIAISLVKNIFETKNLNMNRFVFYTRTGEEIDLKNENKAVKQNTNQEEKSVLLFDLQLTTIDFSVKEME